MHRIATAAIAAAVSITGIFASPAFASTTWDIQAGSAAFVGSELVGGGNRFYPERIAIHRGDTIRFSPVGPHTVTFNRPPGPVFAVLFAPFGGNTISSPGQMVNSGIIVGPPATFSLTFASGLPVGVYTIICGLHLGMRETIHVLPDGMDLPRTPDQVRARAQAEIARDLETRAEIVQDFNEDRGSGEDTDDSAKVLVGLGNRRVTTLRFFPAVTTIHVGDSVTFLKRRDPTEPHTVTFGPENPDPILQLVASGGNTYNGTGTVTSGFLSTRAQYDFYQLAGTPLPVAVTRFKLTFTKAGTWDYICSLHDEVGMRGKVIVLP